MRRRFRVHQKKRGARHRDKKGAFERERRAFFRALYVADGVHGGDRGNDCRRKAVTDGNGEIDYSVRAARINAVERRGVIRIAGEHTDDENTIQNIRKGQNGRRDRDGHGHFQKSRIFHVGRDRTVKRLMRLLYRDKMIGDHKKKRRDLAQSHGEQGIRNRRLHVAAVAVGKVEPEPHFDRLFQNFRNGGGRKVAFALIVSAETGDDGNEKYAGREHHVGSLRGRFALHAAHDRGEDEHRGKADEPERGKQSERA